MFFEKVRASTRKIEVDDPKFCPLNVKEHAEGLTKSLVGNSAITEVNELKNIYFTVFKFIL